LSSSSLTQNSSFFPNVGAIRDIFSHFGTVLRVTVLRNDPLQVCIQFEHPISATALLNSDGMSLGGRPIHARLFSLGGSATPPFKFDPFGQDLPRTLTQSLNRLDAGFIQLNADSQPFVPPTKHSPKQSPTNDRGSSPSNGNSTESKTSIGTSKSAPAERKVIDRWHNSAARCKWVVRDKLMSRAAHCSTSFLPSCFSFTSSRIESFPSTFTLTAISRSRSLRFHVHAHCDHKTLKPDRSCREH